MPVQKRSPLKQNNLLFFLLLFIFLSVLISVYALTYKTKDCGRDTDCFRQNEIICKRSKVEVIQQGNLFSYKIEGSKQSSCKILVKVEQVNPESPQELQNLFEGKDMTCLVPISQLQKISSTKNNDMFDYCTGSLKEATYELIIKKLYGVIAQNLGPILAKADEAINSTKQLK